MHEIQITFSIPKEDAENMYCFARGASEAGEHTFHDFFRAVAESIIPIIGADAAAEMDRSIRTVVGNRLEQLGRLAEEMGDRILAMPPEDQDPPAAAGDGSKVVDYHKTLTRIMKSSEANKWTLANAEAMDYYATEELDYVGAAEEACEQGTGLAAHFSGLDIGMDELWPGALQGEPEVVRAMVACAMPLHLLLAWIRRQNARKILESEVKP